MPWPSTGNEDDKDEDDDVDDGECKSDLLLLMRI